MLKNVMAMIWFELVWIVYVLVEGSRHNQLGRFLAGDARRVGHRNRIVDCYRIPMDGLDLNHPRPIPELTWGKSAITRHI